MSGQKSLQRETSLAPPRSIQQWNHLKERSRFVQQPIKTNFGWKGWNCDFYLDRLQMFTHRVGRVVACLTRIEERYLGAAWRPALNKITSAVNLFLSEFPGGYCESEKDKSSMEILITKISLIPATDEGYDLLRALEDQLMEAHKEIQRDFPDLPLGSVVTPKQVEQLLSFFERNYDLVFPIPDFDLKAALRRLRSQL
ncbi:MAG TPA: hypothetical protein VHX36_02740 [Candidatus Acidoferrales bacterium]|jgi:hypothetical protein|nr:hypothetical protein [Candidatus Acidoferrales bacterium]